MKHWRSKLFETKLKGLEQVYYNRFLFDKMEIFGNDPHKVRDQNCRENKLGGRLMGFACKHLGSEFSVFCETLNTFQ